MARRLKEGSELDKTKAAKTTRKKRLKEWTKDSKGFLGEDQKRRDCRAREWNGQRGEPFA